MSLVMALREPDNELRLWMEQQFPQKRLVLEMWRRQLGKAGTIRPRVSVRWDIVGIALDYRIRYYFPGMDSRSTVAHGGASLWFPGPDEDRRKRTHGFERTDAFFDGLEAFTGQVQPAGKRLDGPDEERLARYCAVLAVFEPIGRLGEDFGYWPLPPPVEWPEAWDYDPTPMLALIPDAWIEDLCALSWGFHDRCNALLDKPAVLNPRFGAWDGDLVVDGCLIDIKSTISPQMRSMWLYQLFGYALADLRDEYHIRDLGIYLARQRTLLRCPLAEAIAMATGPSHPSLQELRERFQEVRRKYFAQGLIRSAPSPTQNG